MNTIGLRLFLPGAPGSEQALEAAVRAERYYVQTAGLDIPRERAEAALEQVMQESRECLVPVDDPWGIAFRHLLDPDPPPPAYREAARKVCAVEGYPAHPENLDAVADTLRRCASRAVTPPGS